MDAAWPLVGREEELEFLFERLAGPEPKAIVVAGVAGVGKTRLSHEALARGSAHGLAVERVQASRSASTIPLGAFAPLLPDGEASPAGPAALLRSAASAIARRASPGRLILAVDDAHDLDDASATLVHHLAAARMVSLVITVRSGVSVPDPITLLWKDGLADRLELQSLSRSQVGELIAAALGGAHHDGAMVQQVWNASRGNPLYVRELIGGALASGALHKDAHVWRLRVPLEAPMRLRELVALRLSGLSSEERDVLELIAIDGTLGLSLLAQRVDTAALERLERSGAIVVDTDERRRPVRPAHPLYAEVVRGQMPVTRMRSLQRTIAELIDRTGCRRRGDVVRLALLRLDADGTADAELLAEAARKAYFTYDLPLAERIARAAVEAGAGWDVRRLLAEILRWQGQHEEAEKIVCAIPSAGLTTDEARALVAMTRAENLFRGLGLRDEASTVLSEAEASVTDPSWRQEIAALRASFDLMAGDVIPALEVARPIAEGSAGRAKIAASVVAAFGLAVSGRTNEAVETSDRAIAAHFELNEEFLISDAGVHAVTRCLALAEAGRLAEAEPAASGGYEWALASGILLGQAWFGMILARIELGAGRLVRAERLFREAAVAFRDVNDPGPCRWCWAGAAQAAAQRGDVNSARDAVSSMDDAAPTLVTLMHVEVERARAWTAAAAGEHSDARSRLLAAADHARARHQLALEADALHDVVRLGRAQDVSERLAQLAARVQGPLAGLRARHAAAVSSRDGEELEAVSVELESLGNVLLAAEAAAQASHAWRKAGRQRRATGASTRARRLAESCEGAGTPALGRPDDVTPLTAREWEISSLVVGGLSNRQIAERLVLSVRTVENHLQHVYEKLGVASRADLGAHLGRRPQTE